MTRCTLPESLKTRSTQPELMDLPTCDPALLATTIRQFGLINRLLSANGRLVKRAFFTHMQKKPHVKYTLLDIGAGGCDIDIRMIREARKRNLKLAITAIDHDERVVAIAREAVAAYPEITLLTCDIAAMPTLGSFDFIFCNHLLHHLDETDIYALLGNIEQQTRIAFLLNDLKRSILAYAGYSLFATCFLAPSLAQSDGRLSIKKGFLEEELQTMAREALPGVPVKIVRAFPARLALFRQKSCGYVT